MVSYKGYNLDGKVLFQTPSFSLSLSSFGLTNAPTVITRHAYINPPYTSSDLEFPLLAFFRCHQAFIAKLHLTCSTTLSHHSS
jgi:hypothetical protein